MKHITKLILLPMVLALLLCAAGCGKDKTPESTPSGTETTAPSKETLPGMEGVEDWSDTPVTQDQQSATEQTTGNQQTGNQEQPTASDPLTLKEYNAMTTAQQQAYFESFSSPDAFYEWLEAAEKADKEQSNTITGDGSLDLNDYINK